jgi:hypothetical protein
MRTLYASVGAVYTLMRFRLYFPNHLEMILMDKKPFPSLFKHLIDLQASNVQWWDTMKPGIYKAAVLGISRDVMVEEISLEKHVEFRHGLRNLAFQTVASTIKSKMISKHSSQKFTTKAIYRTFFKRPRVLLLIRDGATRQILNQDLVIQKLKLFKIQLIVLKFASLSMKEQIQWIDSMDIVISMHGAALSHILFMRPKTCVIELFPYVFKKYIFQNLAEIMGVLYLSWQNNRVSQTRTRFDLIQAKKFTNMTRQRIQRLPIDWYNLDSKNYWRNQDTILDSSFYSVVDVAVERFYKREKKYLIYTPWEQLVNFNLFIYRIIKSLGLNPHAH